MKRKKDRGKLWERFFSRERFHGNVVLNFMRFARFPKGELAAYGRSYHEAAQVLVKHMPSPFDLNKCDPEGKRHGLQHRTTDRSLGIWSTI
jgi:hypothetical protein